MTLTDPSTMSDSLVLFSSDDEESDSHYESTQYENFTSMLKGVPPPTSITVSKFTVEEMLQKYNENKAAFGFGLESGSVEISSLKNPVPFFKYSNSSQLSENIASVAQKVQERYVHMETMSSCNIWLKATLETCGSAKKRLRMRQGVGFSPGRRLSHLARRRQFFSSANLQRLANRENIRQIEIKKNSSLGEGQKKISRIVESEKLKSSKRALFLSPESETPTKYGNTVTIDRKIYSSGSDRKRKLPLQERSKKVEVLEWLSQQNFDMDCSRKRLREECTNHSVERKRKCPRRSLNFTDNDASSNMATSESNNSGDKKTGSSGKLSEIHKNKLLWAISVVLREKSITRNSEHFKTLAAKLFFTCRKNLDEILSMNSVEGTSDKILHFARKIIPSIFEELGIKSSPENNLNADKNYVNSETKKEDELKENINKSNVDSSSNCADNDIKFVFKTPKKIRQKRVIKSCQKAPDSDSKRKKNVLRRWRSLELLIEGAVISSMTNLNINKEKICVSSDFHVNETSQSAEIGKCNGIPNISLTSDRICVPISMIPSLPSVDTSVLFSPIPSSVEKESCNILFSSLQRHQTNQEEGDFLSDERSLSQATDDSMEVGNQDENLQKGIRSFKENGVFPEEYNGETKSDVEDSPVSENTVPLPSKVDVQNEERVSVVGRETKSEVSLIPNKFCHVTNEDCNGSESEKEKDQRDLKSDTINDVREPLTPICISQVEKGTYKPRKLVVKKSKPNWKVVRKNSEEENELRLKMRLSHEWEVVCRNSSYSDIGNNSEYETTSVNCSQVSSATDMELISDNEVEDPSRRNLTQSKCDEGNTKSDVLSRESINLQFDESHDYKSNTGEIGRLNCDGKLLIQAVLAPAYREELYSKTVAGDRLKIEVDDSNVEPDFIRSEEDTTRRHSNNVKENGMKEEKMHADEEVIGGNSSILFQNSRPGEKSKKGKNFNISPETGTKKDNYFPKRSRDSEISRYDSESRNSSFSNGPERKKILLSLENYKARKLEETSNNIKLNASNEESESKDVSTDEKNTTKKIYNIRLKHPIKRHKSKRKHKHKRYNREKDRHMVRERHEEKLEGDTGLHLQKLRQILDGFCENDRTPNLQEAHTQNKDVNIQTIVDALSTLSNIVQEQIKLENDRTNSEKKSEGNTSKKSNWLDVVSTWCGRNLNNLKLSKSLSVKSFDDGSVSAMKKILNLSISQASHSVNNDNGTVDSINSRNLLKTEHKAEDCMASTSPQPMGYSNASLVNLPQISNNQTGYFEKYPVHSTITSQSGFNYPQRFTAEAVKDFRASVDNQPKDPRCNLDSWSKNQHIDSTKEHPSVETPYQYPSMTVQNPSLYQPNMYNYPNWQGDVSSWNYHQSEGYQNSAFYPYKMSNMPYYFNKY